MFEGEGCRLLLGGERIGSLTKAGEGKVSSSGTERKREQDEPVTWEAEGRQRKGVSQLELVAHRQVR